MATGTIRGTIYNDRDATGLLSPGDAGLGGRTVFLDLNHDGILDGHDPSTQTAPDGSFVFSHVAPGTYTVCQVLPGGWVPSSYRLIASAGPTSPADQLIQLDRFRADPSFAGIYGQGESVVVLDTGIDAGNSAFGPEVNGAGDAIVYQHNYFTGSSSAPDGDGHGTFVASIIGSRNPDYLGIAPGVNLIVLKILDNKGNGEFNDIDSALRWVLANARTYHIVCVNMSFGDGGNWTKQESLYGIGGDLAAAGGARRDRGCRCGEQLPRQHANAGVELSRGRSQRHFGRCGLGRQRRRAVAVVEQRQRQLHWAGPDHGVLTAPARQRRGLRSWQHAHRGSRRRGNDHSFGHERGGGGGVRTGGAGAAARGRETRASAFGCPDPHPPELDRRSDPRQPVRSGQRRTHWSGLPPS